jgi:hypothetical protein
MTQISITRALTEIKHLADRINRAASEPFVGIAKGQDKHKVCVNSPSTAVETIQTNLKSNLQSVLSLIARRDTLKRAVVKSNAMTNVVINGQSMTVAEAIEKKASVAFTQQLLNNMRNQFVTSRNKIDAENSKLLAEINVAVQAAYGNEKGKVDEDQYFAVANPRLKLSEYSLIDPNKIEDVIKKIDSDLTGFLQEVDFILSEVNAKTEITVD